MSNLFTWIMLAVYVSTVESHDLNQNLIGTDESMGNPSNNVPVEWKNCVDSSAPIQVRQFDVSPHPLILGNISTFTVGFDVKETIGQPPEHIWMDGSVKMKIGPIYRDICNLLSVKCNLNDFCKTLSHSQLPPFFRCPIPKFSFRNAKYTDPIKGIGFDIHGSFEIAVALKNQTSMLGCVVIRFCVKSKPKWVVYFLQMRLIFLFCSLFRSCSP